MNDAVRSGSNAGALLRRFAADRRGATAVEYGLIVAGISIAIAAALYGLSDQLTAVFTKLIAFLAAHSG
jgi:pilus assembly protein Flp/PilA